MEKKSNIVRERTVAYYSKYSGPMFVKFLVLADGSAFRVYEDAQFASEEVPNDLFTRLFAANVGDSVAYVYSASSGFKVTQVIFR